MKFEVLILGSNSALPAHGRHPSAQLVNHHDALYLVDCGEGTQMQMSQYQVRRSKIDVVFISHLHGDHIFGLPGLLTSYILNGRKNPLKVIGPVGLQRFIDVTLNLKETTMPYELDIEEIDATIYKKVYENKLIEVYSLPLHHRIPTAGYKFVEKEKERHIIPEEIQKWDIPYEHLSAVKKGKDPLSRAGEIVKNHLLTSDPDPIYSFAYCSDTAYFPEVVPMIKGVSLLYHEATFMDMHKDQAEKRFHSTTKEAAQIARSAGVDKLLIGHFSSRYVELESMIEECRAVFAPSYLAEEGKIFKINPNYN